MIDIKPLRSIDSTLLDRLIVGYISREVYRAAYTHDEHLIQFVLERVPLETPYIKRFDPTDSETLMFYQKALTEDASFGAYDGETCVGLALASQQEWNNSLRVHELHVADAYQGRGVGRRLLEAVVARAQDAHLRVVVCETQSTNVPAIDFYQRMDFVPHGIDLSLYSNEDWPDGEVAIYMKRILA